MNPVERSKNPGGDGPIDPLQVRSCEEEVPGSFDYSPVTNDGRNPARHHLLSLAGKRNARKVYPETILQVQQWPLWRKLFKLPSDHTDERCHAWDRLCELRQEPNQSLQLKYKPGIFGSSRINWWMMDHFRSTTFEFRDPSHYWPANTTNRFSSPFGKLVLKSQVEHFYCDARDIEGFEASKSEGMPHMSVDAFGKYFFEEENERKAQLGRHPLVYDEASWLEMRNHNENRVLLIPGRESFTIQAWDGRLFLENSGGSHHVAAAAHIARQINRSMPITEKLNLLKLNVGTARWMLDGFHMLLLPRDMARSIRYIASVLLGEVASMDMPSSMVEGTLIAFPKDSQMADTIMSELMEMQCTNFGTVLEGALQAQSKNLLSSKLAKLPFPAEN